MPVSGRSGAQVLIALDTTMRARADEIIDAWESGESFPDSAMQAAYDLAMRLREASRRGGQIAG